jgi:dTDP-4-amino-4,6-dideoxygalactose transaminase
MVSWVPKKKIDHSLVEKLLSLSDAKNQYTNGGPVVALLESKVRALLKIDSTKSVVCVSNGTVALWAAVAAIELYERKSLQFCTQSFTFPASAQGYLDNVLIIDNDEGGPDLEKVDISGCDGIIVTNVFGNVVDIAKYEEWCATHGKFLLFDNAATSYSFYRGKNSCNYGHASTISFHHTKPIGFGEGGAIIIDSKYERCLRNAINFGIDNTSPTAKWHRFGGNYKMSDVQAAYILQYLERFDELIAKSEQLYSYFVEKLRAHKEIRLFPNYSDTPPFLSCLSILISNSEQTIKALLERNIYCRKYYNPLEDTPVATDLYNRIVCISFTVDMSISDIDTILEIISCEERGNELSE